VANYRDSTNTNNKSNKISVDLQTAFAPETRLAEGQWLEEQQKIVKLRMQ
jgi:hypothetical protein